MLEYWQIKLFTSSKLLQLNIIFKDVVSYIRIHVTNAIFKSIWCLAMMFE